MNALNRQWRLASRPVGDAKESDFAWKEEPIPALADGQVLARNIYLSLDPTQRVWMNDADSYLPRLELGAVMRGVCIATVEDSKNPHFSPGDMVLGLLGWQEFAVSDGVGLTKLSRLPLPFTAYFGLLGHIGFTAYFGLLDIGKPKAGETLVVTAAAGAVGSLAGQIGKIMGCRVIGIAGSEEKCAWIRNDLGFDGAINYRTENVYNALREHCPRGIDIGFENVGGPNFDAILALINLRARIVLCGMISLYNAMAPQPGPSLLFRLISQRAQMEGFIVTDFASRFGEAAPKLVQWALAGKLKYRLDVIQGLKAAPQALLKLYSGTNKGKLLVKISEEPAS
jgi:NADPH-dependent curcumin reductase